MLLIFSYTSDGVEIYPALGLFSPSYEGVSAGVIQLERLLMMLALLSILNKILSQEKLVTGLYTLLAVISCLGISRSRVSVRLALTIRYAENNMHKSVSSLQELVDRIHLTNYPIDENVIDLKINVLSLIDWFLIGVSTASVIGVIW